MPIKKSAAQADAMTLRDTIAMHALTGLVAVDTWIMLKQDQLAGSHIKPPELPHPARHAARAYQIADAVLAIRQVG